MSRNHHATYDRTADPIAVPDGRDTDKQIPEFLRLPRSGSRCVLTGLSRATLNALILGDKPLVKSICLRQRGAARGIRLLVTSSLLEFLYKHVVENSADSPELAREEQE
jgi:hypothetical protein